MNVTLSTGNHPYNKEREKSRAEQSTTLRGVMESSTGFTTLEAMIEKNWVTNISHFDQLLKQLEEDGHVTAAQHRSLVMQLVGKSREKGASQSQ